MKLYSWQGLTGGVLIIAIVVLAQFKITEDKVSVSKDNFVFLQLDDQAESYTHLVKDGMRVRAGDKLMEHFVEEDRIVLCASTSGIFYHGKREEGGAYILPSFFQEVLFEYSGSGRFVPELGARVSLKSETESLQGSIETIVRPIDSRNLVLGIVVSGDIDGEALRPGSTFEIQHIAHSNEQNSRHVLLH